MVFFDMMNLVIGVIVGCRHLYRRGIWRRIFGTSLDTDWIIAGLMAITIALFFAECSSIIP